MQKLVIIIATCMLAGSLLASSANGITIEQLQSSCKYCKCLDKPLEDYYRAVQGNRWLKPFSRLYSTELGGMIKLNKRITREENVEYNLNLLAVRDNELEDNIDNFDSYDVPEIYASKLGQISSIWTDEDCRRFFLFELYKKLDSFQ